MRGVAAPKSVEFHFQGLRLQGSSLPDLLASGSLALTAEGLGY